MGRTLIFAGLAIACLGALMVLSQSAPGLRIGRLPGDIHIERPGMNLYIPITTMLLASAALSGVLWLVSRFKR